MKKLPHLTLSLALALAGFSTARADTIHNGSYTAEITKTGGMTFSALGINSISFSHEHLTGGGPLSFVQASGTLTATFQADPGLIFDKFSFGGMGGGAIFNEETGVYADFNWTVNGGTFITGTPTYGGFNGETANPFRAERREWEITGPNTGRSSVYDGYWYRTRLYDFNYSQGGYGDFAIGASSFSIDLSALVTVSRYYGGWPGAIDPQALIFGFSYLPAPPPTSSVPETGATAGLMLLGLAGLAGARRLAAARTVSV